MVILRKSFMYKTTFLLYLLYFNVFAAYAVKLNQRGEKMVAKVDVAYPTDGYFPYSINFGYESSDEINSVVFERKGIDHLIIKMGRTEKMEIWRQDYVDGKKYGYYTFKNDSQGRPIEIKRFSPDIYGKNSLDYTYRYEYDFQDYALSIVSIEADDTWAAKRDLVKRVNGNGYTLFNVINLETKGESKPSISDSDLSYSNIRNDFNIDILQIVHGYCSVGGITMMLLDNNFVSLVNWTNSKSRNLPLSCRKSKFEYLRNDSGDITQVIIRSIYTEETLYKISITYIYE